MLSSNGFLVLVLPSPKHAKMNDQSLHNLMPGSDTSQGFRVSSNFVLSFATSVFERDRTQRLSIPMILLQQPFLAFASSGESKNDDQQPWRGDKFVSNSICLECMTSKHQMWILINECGSQIWLFHEEKLMVILNVNFHTRGMHQLCC